MGFNGQAQVREMIPCGVAAYEGAGDDFAGVVVEGEDEHGVVLGWPPGMRRTVVLPELTDGAGLPAASQFGAALGGGDLLWKMLTDIGGDRGARAVKVQTAGQFVGQQSEIERLAAG